MRKHVKSSHGPYPRITAVYHGFIRDDGKCAVRVTFDSIVRHRIDHRTDLQNHSPGGIAWGYNGSGPAQCSLAILADFFGDDKRALSLYQEFKREVIAKFEIDKEWTLTGQQIMDSMAICNGIIKDVLDA